MSGFSSLKKLKIDIDFADIAIKAGATVPFLRPDELATDTAPTIDVVKHVLNFYREKKSKSFDYVILLEPTSPLREDTDIDNMLFKINKEAELFDSIISLGEVDEHPSIIKKIAGENIEPFCAELQLTTRRQDNQPAFFPYGVAYIVKTKALLEEHSFYTQRCTYYLIKRYQNYEIDDIYDFWCVEKIASEMKGVLQ